MTDDRITPELLDELVSAAHDGELVGAARDLGIPIAEAEALVAGATHRRTAFATVRDLVREVEPLDELTRRRVLHATRLDPVDAGAHSPGRPRSFAFATAAASVLVVGAAVIGISQLAGDTSKSADRASATTEVAPKGVDGLAAGGANGSTTIVPGQERATDAAVPDLGQVETDTDLRRIASERHLDARPTSGSTVATSDPAQYATACTVDAGRTDVVSRGLVGNGTAPDHDLVQVWLDRTPDHAFLVAIDPATCEQLAVLLLTS